jgi:hypothetical protein
MPGREGRARRTTWRLVPVCVTCVACSLLAMPSVAAPQKAKQWQLNCLVNHGNCVFSISGTIVSRKHTEGKGTKPRDDGGSEEVDATVDDQVTISVNGTRDDKNGTVAADWTVDRMDDHRKVTTTHAPSRGLCATVTNNSTWFHKTCTSGSSTRIDMLEKSGQGSITLSLPTGPKYMSHPYSVSLIGGLPALKGRAVNEEVVTCVGVVCPGEQPIHVPPPVAVDITLRPDVIMYADGSLDPASPFHLKGTQPLKPFTAEPYPRAMGTTDGSISWDLTITVTPKKPDDVLPPLVPKKRR